MTRQKPALPEAQAQADTERALDFTRTISELVQNVYREPSSANDIARRAASIVQQIKDLGNSSCRRDEVGIASLAALHVVRNAVQEFEMTRRTGGDDKEVYLGDGLYASFNGDTIWLRAPREDGDHEVALEPEVFWELLSAVSQHLPAHWASISRRIGK